MANKGEQHTGGRGGIRTHGALAGTPVFKTGALNHSATLPWLRHQSLSGGKIKNRSTTGPNLDPIPKPQGLRSVGRAGQARSWAGLPGRLLVGPSIRLLFPPSV